MNMLWRVGLFKKDYCQLDIVNEEVFDIFEFLNSSPETELILSVSTLHGMTR